MGLQEVLEYLWNRQDQPQNFSGEKNNERDPNAPVELIR
ncbi:Uncharacterised protein [Escherichia coli]|nr:Uncharacterised protein [Escherichia coli]